MPRITVLLLALLATTSALAQDDVPEDRLVLFKPVTEIDMERVDVDAAVEKPAITLGTELTGLEFHPMIRLRKSFDEEMRQSLFEVQ